MLNPSEISDVLKQELENINSKVKFEEVGTVLSVGDGVAHVYGLENVRSNELVEFENGAKGVALNLEESNVGVVLLDKMNSITENRVREHVCQAHGRDCVYSGWRGASRARHQHARRAYRRQGAYRG